MNHHPDESDASLLEESFCLAVPTTAQVKLIESLKANFRSLDSKLKPVSVSSLIQQRPMLQNFSAGSSRHQVTKKEQSQQETSEKKTTLQSSFQTEENILRSEAQFLQMPQINFFRTNTIRKCDKKLVEPISSLICGPATSNLSVPIHVRLDPSPAATSEAVSSSSWIEEYSVQGDEPFQGLFQIEPLDEDSKSMICSIESLLLRSSLSAIRTVGEGTPIDTVIDYQQLFESNPTYQQCWQLKYCTQSKAKI